MRESLDLVHADGAPGTQRTTLFGKELDAGKVRGR
jgi:hypothetical protein